MWQSTKTVPRGGKKSKEHFYCTSQSSKKATVFVVEVLFRGEPQFRKYFLVQKYFELYPKFVLKLPFIMRRASLDMTKATAFQTLLESTQRFLFWWLKGQRERVLKSSIGTAKPCLLCSSYHYNGYSDFFICKGLQANKMKSKESTSVINVQSKQCLSDGVFVAKFVPHQVPVMLDCPPEYKFQHTAPYTPTIHSSDTEFGYAGWFFSTQPHVKNNHWKIKQCYISSLQYIQNITRDKNNFYLHMLLGLSVDACRSRKNRTIIFLCIHYTRNKFQQLNL